MATEKQIMMRINATKNISKITQSMKMVSAAKLRGDQARLDKAQPFNVSLVHAFKSLRAGLFRHGLPMRVLLCISMVVGCVVLSYV